MEVSEIPQKLANFRENCSISVSFGTMEVFQITIVRKPLSLREPILRPTEVSTGWGRGQDGANFRKL
jgi:hypothetical protein